MTVHDLGMKLKDLYDNAPRGEQIAMVHLFGIIYNQEIEKVGIREVVEEAGIPATLKVEVNKGTKLAKYVAVKQDYSDQFHKK